MSTTYFYDWQKKSETSGRVTFLEGNGGLPKMEVVCAMATAEIYLQGAHVTHFQKNGEEPLLFLSSVSRFEKGKPIRGGIPVIYPWFGARDGQGSHGFARVHEWELWETTMMPTGGVRLQFRLPHYPEADLYPACDLNYSVTVGETLTCELSVTNKSESNEVEFENCLHTYFQVGDAEKVRITGLDGATFMDKVDDFTRKTQSGDSLAISGEVDRVYFDSPGAIELVDESIGRKIRIDKSGSLSTVVWNPWIVKSERLPDFGNEDYRRMVCIESGNIAKNQVALPPGQSAALKVKYITNKL